MTLPSRADGGASLNARKKREFMEISRRVLSKYGADAWNICSSFHRRPHDGNRERYRSTADGRETAKTPWCCKAVANKRVRTSGVCSKVNFFAVTERPSPEQITSAGSVPHRKSVSFQTSNGRPG